MTTYLTNYNSSIYSTSYNDQYNGVVNISDGSYSGTGSLLYDGKTVLTAAHVVDQAPNNRVTVYFDTATTPIAINGSVVVHSGYDSENSNSDVATIVLDEHAPIEYQRYQLYRDFDELGQDFIMAGYGMIGNGRRGEIDQNYDNEKLITQNTFDADFYDVYTNVNGLSWTPLRNSILTADFDNGMTVNDALGGLLDINDLGLGVYEGMIASGDSGGPTFLDGKVAGIASYSASIGTYDIDYEVNSSFGELGAWQRVSYFQEWIDTQIRSNYENAPNSISAVERSINELDEGILTNYFLITIDRKKLQGDITIEYTTIDGTATAGEDYLYSSGTITIYNQEDQAVIPIEIIGDNLSEANETFFLKLTNPINGTFDNGLTSLISQRTILDNEIKSSNTEHNMTYYTTENYINETFGLNMEQTFEIVSTYLVLEVEMMYNIFKEYKVNADMISDILEPLLPGLEAQNVFDFYALSELDGEALGTYYDDTIFIA